MNQWNIMFTSGYPDNQCLLRAMFSWHGPAGSYFYSTSTKRDWKFHSQPALMQRSLTRFICCKRHALYDSRPDRFEKTNRSSITRSKIKQIEEKTYPGRRLEVHFLNEICAQRFSLPAWSLY